MTMNRNESRWLAVLTCALAAMLGCSGAMRTPAPVAELDIARRIVDSSGFAGTILLFDSRRQSYEAGHAERSDLRLIPASTFKIFNTLVALETGVVADAATVLPWDSVVRGRTELNRDLDLRTAFRLSAVPHFQEIARRIGPERMQRFIDTVGYGNRDISGGIDRFWLTGGLRISPREQIEFLMRLHRGELPFSARAMAAVREIMETERTADYAIAAKTGWSSMPDSSDVGWWVGWVERGRDTLFFATALQSRRDDALGPARQAVTRAVLKRLGWLGE